MPVVRVSLSWARTKVQSVMMYAGQRFVGVVVVVLFVQTLHTTAPLHKIYLLDVVAVKPPGAMPNYANATQRRCLVCSTPADSPSTDGDHGRDT